MSDWNGATVMVTGAASGIGLALSIAMVKRGADVWMTDVNGPGVQQAAEALGPKARWAKLDVRDTLAMREVIERIARDRERLDYLFNNAGIGVGGEAHELSVPHYDRILDVNVRGVVNGVAAAYPIMVRQRSGHIVNTASMAGLTPAPLLVPYAMTKHAVVGLSTSLRLEARNFGVRVSALCPSAIDTPILDADNPGDLPKLPWRPDIRRFLTKLCGPPYPPTRLAAEALRGVERDQALIVVPRIARVIALLYRFAPGLVSFGTGFTLRQTLNERPEGV
ncbi:MAG: SDR family oxidoreductase [Deltaproteobacteria bacterium]|nr:SDR family oxidoreductase [Deltaproteobacteria bacterium]